MLRTSPVALPTVIQSPTVNERSPIKKMPLIRFDMLVWEAKPNATVRMPAAPKNTLMSMPPRCSAASVTRMASP
jgi:hypothetical protein